MKKLTTCLIAVLGLIATPALAADMAVKAPPPVPETVYNWTGFYVGVNAGWSWGKDGGTLSIPGPFSVIGGCCSGFLTAINAQESNEENGAIGGVQIGYNWQATPKWILGLEADIQASGEGASADHQTVLFNGGPRISTILTQSASHNSSLLWFGTVRGRAGYAFWPTVMLYGTGGLAYGRFSDFFSSTWTQQEQFVSGVITQHVTIGLQPFDVSTTQTGWTVGGGIEGAVPDTRVTWKAEYLYIDLGTRNLTFTDPTGFFGTLNFSSHFTDHIFRVGLNYQFH